MLLNYENYGRLFNVYARSAISYATPRKIWNAIRTEYAYRKRLSDVCTPPYILFLEPLYYCNLDCPLCDRQVFPQVRKSKKDAGRLPLDIVEKVLDEIGDYLFQCQIFGQGEPLIDWPLSRRIIERVHRRKIFTLLCTNATLVNPPIADEVVSCGLDHLVCAIDGISQGSYGKYRVGAPIEVALEGLRLFSESKRRNKSRIFIEWQYLVHKFNVHEMEEARKIARQLDVHIRFHPLRGMEFDPKLQEEWLPAPGTDDENHSWRAGKVERGNFVHAFPCYFLWRAVTLNSNARLAKCLIFQNVAEFGNLTDSSVMGLFNGPEIQQARLLFKKGAIPDTDFPSPCKNCSFFQREHGGPYLDKHESIGLPSKAMSSTI